MQGEFTNLAGESQDVVVADDLVDAVVVADDLVVAVVVADDLVVAVVVADDLAVAVVVADAVVVAEIPNGQGFAAATNGSLEAGEPPCPRSGGRCRPQVFFAEKKRNWFTKSGIKEIQSFLIVLMSNANQGCLRAQPEVCITGNASNSNSVILQ